MGSSATRVILLLVVDLLCFFFLKIFCPDISKNLKFFFESFREQAARHSEVTDRGYSRRSGRGQSQRQCCDCQQQENDGETEGIIARLRPSIVSCRKAL